ncbi:hypothetical protein K438DRAFT_1786157 [Mycena galopus ATCC 62051]|nr:hypothetical protein K438DRAFT_1786157 [Mycena galopus ATCC 62051]
MWPAAIWVATHGLPVAQRVAWLLAAAMLRVSSREVWMVPLPRKTCICVALRGGYSAGGRVLGPQRSGRGEGDQLPGINFRSHPCWSRGWGGGFTCAKRWTLKVVPVALSVDTVLGDTKVAVVGVHGVCAAVVQWAWVLGLRGGSRHAGMVGLEGWACSPASQQACHTGRQASQENLVGWTKAEKKSDAPRGVDAALLSRAGNKGGRVGSIDRAKTL